MKMKLATYNICHCGNYENCQEGDDLPVNIARTAEAIAEINADIIGLNEVYTAGEREDFCRQEEKLAKLPGIEADKADTKGDIINHCLCCSEMLLFNEGVGYLIAVKHRKKAEKNLHNRVKKAKGKIHIEIYAKHRRNK